jgi:hypothetical protein
MLTQHPFVEPSAVTIALPDEQVVLCHEVFGEAGLRVHRAEHVLAACERIAKLLPQVVVTSTALRNDVREMVEECAVAVGAGLVELPPHRDFGMIERDLDDAVRTARRRLGLRRPPDVAPTSTHSLRDG